MYFDPKTGKVPACKDKIFRQEKRKFIMAMGIEVFYVFDTSKKLTDAGNGIRSDLKSITKDGFNGLKCCDTGINVISYKSDIRPYYLFRVWLNSFYNVICDIYYNYGIMNLLYFCRFHHCRYYYNHDNPKLNPFIYGFGNTGKSFMFGIIEKICPTGVCKPLSKMTANWSQTNENRDEKLYLFNEFQNSFLGVNDKFAGAAAAANSNADDRVNYLKNMLTSGKSSTSSGVFGDDGSRKNVDSTASLQLNIFAASNSALHALDKDILARLLIISVPLMINDSGGVKHHQNELIAKEKLKNGQVMYEQHKMIHRVYYLTEQMIKSGVLYDHDMGVTSEFALIAINRILNDLQTEYGIQTGSDRKRNAVLEIARSMCIAAASFNALTSVLLRYLQYHPTQVDENNDPVFIGFNPRVMFEGVFPFLVILKDHVIDALLSSRSIWEHDYLEKIITPITTKFCNLDTLREADFRRVYEENSPDNQTSSSQYKKTKRGHQSGRAPAGGVATGEEEEGKEDVGERGNDDIGNNVVIANDNSQSNSHHKRKISFGHNAEINNGTSSLVDNEVNPFPLIIGSNDKKESPSPQPLKSTGVSSSSSSSSSAASSAVANITEIAYVTNGAEIKLIQSLQSVAVEALEDIKDIDPYSVLSSSSTEVIHPRGLGTSSLKKPDPYMFKEISTNHNNTPRFSIDYNYITLSAKEYKGIYVKISKESGDLEIKYDDVRKILMDLEDDFSDDLPSYTLEIIQVDPQDFNANRFVPVANNITSACTKKDTPCDEQVTDILKSRLHSLYVNNRSAFHGGDDGINQKQRGYSSNREEDEESSDESDEMNGFDDYYQSKNYDNTNSDVRPSADGKYYVKRLVRSKDPSLICKRQKVIMDNHNGKSRISVLVSYLKQKLPHILTDDLIEDLDPTSPISRRNRDNLQQSKTSQEWLKSKLNTTDTASSAVDDEKSKKFRLINERCFVNTQNLSISSTMTNAIKGFYENSVLEVTNISREDEQARFFDNYKDGFFGHVPWFDYATCIAPPSLSIEEFDEGTMKEYRKQRLGNQSEISFVDVLCALRLNRRDDVKPKPYVNNQITPPSASLCLSIYDPNEHGRNPDVLVKNVTRIVNTTECFRFDEDLDFTACKMHLDFICYKAPCNNPLSACISYPPYHFMMQVEHYREYMLRDLSFAVKIGAHDFKGRYSYPCLDILAKVENCIKTMRSAIDPSSSPERISSLVFGNYEKIDTYGLEFNVTRLKDIEIQRAIRQSKSSSSKKVSGEVLLRKNQEINRKKQEEESRNLFNGLEILKKQVKPTKEGSNTYSKTSKSTSSSKSKASTSSKTKTSSSRTTKSSDISKKSTSKTASVVTNITSVVTSVATSTATATSSSSTVTTTHNIDPLKDDNVYNHAESPVAIITNEHPSTPPSNTDNVNSKPVTQPPVKVQVSQENPTHTQNQQKEGMNILNTDIHPPGQPMSVRGTKFTGHHPDINTKEANSLRTPTSILPNEPNGPSVSPRHVPLDIPLSIGKFHANDIASQIDRI